MRSISSHVRPLILTQGYQSIRCAQPSRRQNGKGPRLVTPSAGPDPWCDVAALYFALPPKGALIILLSFPDCKDDTKAHDAAAAEATTGSAFERGWLARGSAVRSSGYSEFHNLDTNHGGATGNCSVRSEGGHAAGPRTFESSGEPVKVTTQMTVARHPHVVLQPYVTFANPTCSLANLFIVSS